MKKILLLTLLIALSFTNIKAQALPIVTYEITATGTSKGLSIPSPHYITVMALEAEIDAAVGFVLSSYTKTTTDSTLTNLVLNDSISPNKKYPMSLEEVDTLTLEGMVERYIKNNLDSIYGAENVIKR